MRNSIQIREEEHRALLFEYAAKAGFKEVAVSFGSGEMIFHEGFEREAENIREQLEKHGLICTQTHLPCYHLLVSAEVVKDEVEAAIRNGLRASRILGAKWAAWHPRTSITDGYSRASSFASNRAALLGCLDVAEKCGVGIAVENMPLYPFTNPAWRFFGGGWEELCELVDSLDSDYIGVCWDFGHAHTAALDQPAALRAIGGRLKITHVHDNYRNGDHHQLPLLGSAEWKCVDWEKTMRAVSGIGYDGPLTLEVIYPPLPMLESFVKCGFDCLTYLQSLAGR